MQRLPPCRVCNGNASGFHYGVNTCVACKGFFRRARILKTPKPCAGNGNCDVTSYKRNSCPSCRYKKCLAVGMSIRAIKTGRYSYIKRTQDTLEINMLKEGKSLPVQKRRGSTRIDFPTHTPTAGMDYERLINLLRESHDKHLKIAFSASAVDIMELEQQAYYDLYRFNRDTCGSFMPLSTSEHEEICWTIGFDSDDRQYMMNMVAETMEFDIRQYIKFMKSLPDIQMLSSDDKANLIKNASFEFLFLGSFRGYNNKLKILSTSSGKCLHLQEICTLIDEDFLLAVFNFSDSLKSLNLSDDECVLIKTFLVFFGDRCELQKPEQVESIQWKIMCSLLYLLARTHAKPNLRFAKILDRLTALRSLTAWNKQIAKSLCKWRAVQERPLLLEMLTL